MKHFYTASFNDAQGKRSPTIRCTVEGLISISLAIIRVVYLECSSTQLHPQYSKICLIVLLMMAQKARKSFKFERKQTSSACLFYMTWTNYIIWITTAQTRQWTCDMEYEATATDIIYVYEYKSTNKHRHLMTNKHRDLMTIYIQI